LVGLKANGIFEGIADCLGCLAGGRQPATSNGLVQMEEVLAKFSKSGRSGLLCGKRKRSGNRHWIIVDLRSCG
jgi:hypothetical protein